MSDSEGLKTSVRLKGGVEIELIRYHSTDGSQVMDELVAHAIKLFKEVSL